MDYNQLPLSLGFLGMENQIEADRFSNLSDDEKKEYIERNRSRLSDDVVDRLTSSIAEDDIMSVSEKDELAHTASGEWRS